MPRHILDYAISFRPTSLNFISSVFISPFISCPPLSRLFNVPPFLRPRNPSLILFANSIIISSSFFSYISIAPSYLSSHSGYLASYAAHYSFSSILHCFLTFHFSFFTIPPLFRSLTPLPPSSSSVFLLIFLSSHITLSFHILNWLSYLLTLLSLFHLLPLLSCYFLFLVVVRHAVAQ